MIDLLENAGLPLPAYQNELKKVREQYPVISAMQVRDAQGNRQELDSLDEELNGYRSLEYYLLFDYAQKDSDGNGE